MSVSDLFLLNYSRTIERCRNYGINECYDPNFWARKAQFKYNIAQSEFYNTNLSPNLRYLEIAAYMDGDVSIKSLQVIPLELFIKLVVSNERYDILSEADTQNLSELILALYKYAIDTGNVKFITESYYNAEKAALLAIIASDIELYKNILKNIPIEDYINIEWNRFISAGMDSNNIDIYNAVLETVPKEIIDGLTYVKLLKMALLSDSSNIFIYILNSDPIQKQNIDWNILANYALRFSKFDMFYLVLSLGPPNYPWNWNKFKANPFMEEDILKAKIKYYEPLLNLTFNQLKDICNSTPTLNIYNDVDFWTEKAHRDLGIPTEAFGKAQSDPMNRYHQLLIAHEMTNMTNLIDTAIIQNNINYLKYAIETGYDYNDILLRIAANGNIALFATILNLLPTNQQIKWNEILEQTLAHNYTEFFKYIISKVPNISNNEWNGILNFAFTRSNMEMLNTVISSIPIDTTIRWFLIIENVITTQNIERIKMVLSLAINKGDIYWESLIIRGLETNNQEVINTILSFILNRYIINWKTIIEYLLSTNKINLIKYLPPDLNTDNVNWEKLVCDYISGRDVKRFNDVFSLGLIKRKLDSTVLADCADKMWNGSNKLLYIVEHFPQLISDWNVLIPVINKNVDWGK